MENAKAPYTYDAQGEFLKDVNRNRTSGNIPAHIMRQAQHKIVEALQNSAVVKASLHPGFSARVDRWNTFTNDQKYVEGAGMHDEDEIKAAIIMESDPTIIRFLADRIDSIRAENEPKE